MSAAKKAIKGRLNTSYRVEKISKYFSPSVKKSARRRKMSVSQENQPKDLIAVDHIAISDRRETRVTETKNKTVTNDMSKTSTN